VTLRVTGDGCLLAVAFLATSLIARAWAAQTTHFIEPPGWKNFLAYASLLEYTARGVR
jgi:hypothetical protein